MKKHFLAQFVLEVDTTNKPSFDAVDARMAISLVVNEETPGQTRRVIVYPLACMPDETGDIVIETFEYEGFEIYIFQNADTVGADVPTYFATAANLATKSRWGSVLSGDFNSIESAIAAPKPLWINGRLGSGFKRSLKRSSQAPTSYSRKLHKGLA